MKRLLSLGLFLLCMSSIAQIITPGTGVRWTLDSLVTHAPLSFSNSNGAFIQEFDDVEISSNDTLYLAPGTIWLVDSGLRITVKGSFIADGNGSIFIQGLDSTKHYDGFRFEEFSVAEITGANFVYGGGLKVLTETFFMDSSSVSYNNSGVSTGSAISFSRGRPVVQNSTFWYNELPAFSSGANIEVAPRLINNVLVRNNQGNSNRPQINLGPSGANDTTIIRRNLIVGDSAATQVGGISVSSLLSVPLNAIIDSNEIYSNRYGITMAGASIYGRINANIIEDNNIQGNPMLGGSGISLNNNSGNYYVEASYNEIRRNLWGITLLGSAVINLGDTASSNFVAGKNIFSDNGNNGLVYALYNNTSQTISAMNNCWEEDTTKALGAEDVITHLFDDNTLGEVIYAPVWNCKESGISVEEVEVKQLEVYPNPSNGIFTVNAPSPLSVEIIDLRGMKVWNGQLDAGQNRLNLDLSTGVYILNCHSKDERYTQKISIR